MRRTQVREADECGTEVSTTCYEMLVTKILNVWPQPYLPPNNHFLSNKLETFSLGHFSILTSLLLLFRDKHSEPWHRLFQEKVSCFASRLLAKILSREILLHNLCKVRPSQSRFLNTLPPQNAGGGKRSSPAVFPWGSWASSSASCCHSLDNWFVTVHSPSALCVQPQGKSSTGKHRAHPSVLAGLPSFLGVLSSQALGLWPEKTQLHLLYLSSVIPMLSQPQARRGLTTQFKLQCPMIHPIICCYSSLGWAPLKSEQEADREIYTAILTVKSYSP